jgi:hypothetical protein
LDGQEVKVGEQSDAGRAGHPNLGAREAAAARRLDQSENEETQEKENSQRRQRNPGDFGVSTGVNDIAIGVTTKAAERRAALDSRFQSGMLHEEIQANAGS